MPAYLDPILLARAQWAFTMTFHIVFPVISIGLASYLAVLEGLWLATGHDVYLNLYKYWLKIFSVVFGMGVVSGLVMSYQFGSNWSAFSDKAGPIIGPLMAYEVLTAFFLESGFLGVMLFGLKRVGRSLHYVATLAVALGTLLSAFWILAANSWMQTPSGFAINAVGHHWGSRPYDNLATNNQWLAWLVAGEGLHNNHHAATTSGRLSLAKGEFDPAWWVVRLMVRFKWAKLRHENITPKTARRLPVGV